MSNVKTEKRKINSFVKIFLWMLLGAIIGGCVGAGVSIIQRTSGSDFGDVLEALVGIIQSNIVMLMWVLCIASIVLLPLLYLKCEKILKSFEGSQAEDEELDLLDYQFECWSTVGVAISNTIMITGIVLFTFSFAAFDDTTGAGVPTIVSVIIPFLLGTICTSIYQVIAVKQTKKKDPMKNGEVMDLNFQKEWLESCDEAEKRVVFEAGYKTIMFMKGFMMFLLVIAMLGQLFWGIGLGAVVLSGIGYIGMLTAYSVYSVKLQKTKLSN